MAIKRQKIMADFETTPDPEDVRVWAACAVDIDTLATVHLGNSLEGFMEWLEGKNTVCYFHNLKFDGAFILDYLLNHGYTYSPSPRVRAFDTLITAEGLFYSITVWYELGNKKQKKVVFYDSLKKLPFRVAVISKAFQLPDAKLEIEYEARRDRGHELTPEEQDYIVNDCRIVAQALAIQMDQGLKKMTNASDAMGGFKEIIGRRQFEQLFPVLPVELDADIRRAYKGGFVYLNPAYKNVRGTQGVTLDVNSLYPYIMYDRLLPYGYPMYFEGKPEENPDYPLFIARLRCGFDLKEGYIPTIQLKNNRAFIETEYLTTSNDEIVELTLTNVDLALFLEHYDVWCLEYVNGWRFKGKHGIFKEYIDHWMHIKETTTGALRQLAKLMLNSLYGKFATNPVALKKIPYMDADRCVRYAAPLVRGPWTDKKGVLHTEPPKDATVYLGKGRVEVYRLPVEQLRDPVYTAMGAFITAYAREKTIRAAQAVHDRFIYADTDSLHLAGQEVPEGLDIHPTHLGAWKNEGCFEDSKFLRAKTYMETVDGHTKVTCAGMPDNLKEQVTYENFCSGSSFYGKLVPRTYPGGVVLEKTTFTIK